MSKLLLISNLSLGEKSVRASAPKILNSFGKFGGNPWDALRASRILASKKPMSSLMVGGRGLEPPILSEHAPKACAYTNSATRPLGHISKKPKILTGVVVAHI